MGCELGICVGDMAGFIKGIADGCDSAILPGCCTPNGICCEKFITGGWVKGYGNVNVGS